MGDYEGGRVMAGVIPYTHDDWKKTNADRIRSMSDEELAEFISGKARTFGEEYEGYMSALDWLKQEVSANDS